MDDNNNQRMMRRPEFPASLTDLHRLGKTVHGHDGSSRIIMVRKTDQRTFASMRNGEEPKLETITRETIETFRGQRTECKITTEKKDCEDQLSAELVDIISQQIKKSTRNNSLTRKLNPTMEFQNECLQTHNEYRQRHGVPPLKLNKDLCRLSQQWANTLVRRNTLENSKNKEFGENIYCISTNNANYVLKGSDPVKSWYEEESKKHPYGKEPKGLESSSFSQIVWKETKELGVAYAKLNGKFVAVANYKPAGNMIGNYADNVPPVGGFDVQNNNDVAATLKRLQIHPVQKNLSNGTEGDFVNDFLNAHNVFRRRHGVPPLKLDKKLCKYSEEWAKNLASKNKLEHRKNSPHGENIYCMYSSDMNFTINGRAPVEKWYDEMKQHPFGKEPSNLKSGHFTQVVWKTSELLGVGVAKSRQGYIYVVANYSPAGNFLGNFSENVLPLVSETESLKLLEETRSQVERDVESRCASVSSEMDPEKFIIEGVKAHNEFRKKHGVPDLILSKKLCELAQDWAEHCSRSGTLAHRSNTSFGENTYCVYSSDYSHLPSPKEVVKKWYEEIKDYKFGSENINYNSLHFTQLVWKGSLEVGIGLAKNKKGQTFVVANYNPRGNVIGQFSTNVPRPKP